MTVQPLGILPFVPSRIRRPAKADIKAPRRGWRVAGKALACHARQAAAGTTRTEPLLAWTVMVLVAAGSLGTATVRLPLLVVTSSL